MFCFSEFNCCLQIFLEAKPIFHKWSCWDHCGYEKHNTKSATVLCEQGSPEPTGTAALLEDNFLSNMTINQDKSQLQWISLYNILLKEGVWGAQAPRWNSYGTILAKMLCSLLNKPLVSVPTFVIEPNSSGNSHTLSSRAVSWNASSHCWEIFTYLASRNIDRRGCMSSPRK